MKLNELFTISNELQKLDEVHWIDIYPKGFQDFRKKYLKLSREHKTGWLYVQFTKNDSVMDRNAWQTPDHHDPVGTYAYPIDYVLKYPADVWYGMGSRYMRILQDTSKKCLTLQSIQSDNDAWRLLRNMGFSGSDASEAIRLVTKHYKDRIKGPNRWGRIALQAAQVDVLSNPIGHTKPGMFSKGGPEFRIRTGKEQTELFRKAGYDSIEDRAKTNKSAVINDREPEQIIFLNRNAFRVIDVFALRPGIPDKQLPSMTTNDPNTPRIVRPLVAAIARMMDDQIVEWSRDPKTNVKYDQRYNYYWTKKGRRIGVTFDRPSSYYHNKKMGEKKHKADKLYNSFYAAITIETEYGEIKDNISTHMTFKDGVENLHQRWKNLQERPLLPDWEPETGEKFMVKVKAASDEYYRKEREKKVAKQLMELPEILESIEWASQRYGKPFTPCEDYEQNIYVMETLEFLSNGIRHKGFKNASLELSMEDWLTNMTEWLTLNHREKLLEQVKQLAELIKEAAKERNPEWWIKGGENMFMFLQSEIKEKDALKAAGED